MAGNYVIAGGTSGIGLAIVNRLRNEADRIDIFSREPGSLETDEVVRHHVCDFTQSGIDSGKLPELIHGAAYCPGTINLKSFRSLKPEDFHADLETNLIGAVRFLQSCYAGLRKNTEEAPGSVVLFSTVAVRLGLSLHASVAAAKGAIEGLCRSLAAEWAPRVRVNCLAPALTNTPLAARFFSDDANQSALKAMYPMGRTGTVDDIASAAEFLLSRNSSWVTGQTMGIDGGLSTLHK